jgi:ppGpp synthetase/RelA/SpoT-type nucleotidyltranferase
MQPTYERLRDEVVSTLNTAIDAANLKVYNVSGRVKERESFREKVIENRYQDALGEMHDIVELESCACFSKTSQP